MRVAFCFENSYSILLNKIGILVHHDLRNFNLSNTKQYFKYCLVVYFELSSFFVIYFNFTEKKSIYTELQYVLMHGLR